MGEPTVIDRLIDIERRLRELELSAGMGLSGTDQTIKGSHDRLDALLGAAVATPTQLKLSGANSGVVIAHIARKQVTAGSATAVFSITTTNEAGDTDAGSYDVWVLAGAEHSGGNSAASNIASMSAQYMWTRSNKATGAGVTGTEAEIYQTASAATDAATRDIAGIALTTTEVSEYVVNVEFNVGLSGSAVVNAYIDCLVILKWRTYTTPPVITAL